MKFLAAMGEYGVTFIISIAVAVAAVKCGIALRKTKDAKKQQAEE